MTAAENSRVRIGLVGLGGHGRIIQRASASAVSLDVRIVCDPDPEEARAAADRFDCESVASFEDVLARDDLDAVVLITPNHLHRAQTEEAIQAGLDVFVEKPIANTTADGMAMIDAAERSSRMLMVGHNMRRGRAARLAKEMIDDGRLGIPVSVDIHFSSDTGLRLADDSWRLQPSLCPLMPVMQLGIHAIDLIHYFFAPVVSVSAHARAVAASSGALDNVVSTIETTTGILGVMVSNYCTETAFEYRLSGTEGTVWGTPHDLRFRGRTDASDEVEVHDFRTYDLESYILQMEAFGDAVRTRRAPETDGWGGVRSLAVVEAMEASVKSGCAAAVGLP